MAALKVQATRCGARAAAVVRRVAGSAVAARARQRFIEERRRLLDRLGWPAAAPQKLDVVEFALLPPAARAALLAEFDPAVEALRAAVHDRLTTEPGSGAPEQLVARALAGEISALAEVIAAIERPNLAPDSSYRIEPELKVFLVESALAAIAESGAALLSQHSGAAAPAAA